MICMYRYESTPNETVREFCLKLMNYMKLTPLEGQTFPFIIKSPKGGTMNCVNDRHLLMESFVDNGDLLMIDFRLTPRQFTLACGNMREDEFKPETYSCAICFEYFSFDEGLYDRPIVLKKCQHRFHVRCMAKQTLLCCSLCNQNITNKDVSIIIFLDKFIFFERSSGKPNLNYGVCNDEEIFNIILMKTNQH